VNSDQVFGILLVVFFGLVVPMTLAIGIPLGKAWARRLERRPEGDDRMLAEVDQLKARVGELEERLDFAERMLAQGRETAQLPKGENP
jgi:hypothetical protein